MVGEEVDEPGPEGDVGMTDHHHPHPGPGRGGHPVILREKLIVMYKQKPIYTIRSPLFPLLAGTVAGSIKTGKC